MSVDGLAHFGGTTNAAHAGNHGRNPEKKSEIFAGPMDNIQENSI